MKVSNFPQYAKYFVVIGLFVMFLGHHHLMAQVGSQGTTTIVSVSSDGEYGNGYSMLPSLSANGRYVAFESKATNLIPYDANGSLEDVFVHDRLTGETELISRVNETTSANSFSRLPAISADGRYVAFQSLASNLVPNDDTVTTDIFVYDRQTEEMELITKSFNGSADRGGRNASISADGRYVSFWSASSSLVVGDTNGYWDMFVHDRQTGETKRVSMAFDGTQANGDSFNRSNQAISADGRYITFQSDASNLVPNDTNNYSDVFVYDMQTEEIQLVSVRSTGEQGNWASEHPVISGNGRYVAFQSQATNLIVDGGPLSPSDIYVHDLQSGETTHVSVNSNGGPSFGQSFHPAISGNGRYVTFSSVGSNLVPNDTNGLFDIFVHDRQTSETRRVSTATDGTQANGDNETPAISTLGNVIVFESNASNLASDNNPIWDIFIQDGGLSALPDPIGYWSFDESSGETAFDSSTNGFDAILKNNPIRTPAQMNNGLAFSPIDGSYVRVPDFEFDSDEITVAFWVNHNQISTAHQEYLRTGRNELSIRKGYQDQLLVKLQIDGVRQTLLAPVIDASNVWVHIALTYDGQTITLYKNGVAVADKSVVGQLDAIDASLQFSRNFHTVDGAMDEVRLYDVALSPEEILLLAGQ